MAIKNVLNPSSIAIVGASEREGSFGFNCSYFALKSKVKEVYLVNPTKTELFGKKSYPCLADLPTIPECVAICVPYSRVNDILIQCGELSIHGAVVFASGYSEIPSTDGAEREQEMCEICTKYNISVLGPNCGGFINKVNNVYLWGLWMNPVKMERKETGLSIVSQSGGVVANFFNSTFTDISYALSIGNGCVITPEDYMDYLLEDESTKVLAMYLEGCRKPKAFCNALVKAAKMRKPVVILKGGMSPKGSLSAKAHSGSYAGDADTFRAVAQRYGAILVNSEDELITVCTALLTLEGHYASGGNAANVNLSGAQTTQCADSCYKFDINIPDFDSDTEKNLTSRLPDFATVKNPLDATTELFKDLQRCSELLRFSGSSSNVDLLIFTAANLSPIESFDNKAIAAMLNARHDGYDAPIFIIPNYEMSRDYEKWLTFRKMHVAVLNPGMTGYSEIKALGEFFSYRQYDHCMETAAFDCNMTEPYLTIAEKADTFLSSIGMNYGFTEGKTELKLTVHRDPQFGPVMTIGLGGKYGKYIKNRAFGLCPMNKAEVVSMLSKLDIYELVEKNERLYDDLVAISSFAASKADKLAHITMELGIEPNSVVVGNAAIAYIQL